MHFIEPYFRWRGEYIASEDARSPFYGRVYSEFEFQHRVYNYLIHPQWDDFGSTTLYMKILYVDYEAGTCVIEFIGEWNDAIENIPTRIKTHNERFKALVFFIIIYLLIRFKVKKNQ